ncbi:DNA polymerase Y family protein [Herbaspirillum lusitanum]|uniref:Y-family DNA polymerase n=1 Tax=Herbaspirillum lusitanum TaxID=213312 RepID=UPI002237FE1A|nr:DNA polymerase Y family protein [Herbaspirillum lusitanum]MCW5297883.1 DNA polymerase Y family protein [Herbaspirillum lusitanum]
MRLWIAVHLPLLPLEVFYPNWLGNTAAVVLEHARVMAASSSAQDAGVRHGMRRGGVLALLPQAPMHDRAPEREAQTLFGAATALLQYTPQASFSDDATVLLDIGASLRLFGGIRMLCQRVRCTMHRLGLTAIISCAPTAAGAALLARHGGVRIMKKERLHQCLDRLPVSALLTVAPYLDWLEGIGCRTLSDLRRLPRAGLQRRGHTHMLDTLDCAYGNAPELHAWIEMPPTFRQRIELNERIEHADAALHTVQALLAQLCGWLSARQLAVKQVHVQLEHERGRQAVAPTAIQLALAESTWQDSHLIRLLKERLAHLEISAPIIAVVLEAAETEPMAPASDKLFPEPGGSPADYKRLLELLVARLGADKVLQASPLADYRPEQANRWVPVMATATSLDHRPLPPRPTWLLEQPVVLPLRAHRPYYGARLRPVSPPERIEAGWWNGLLVTRDYYIAEGANHCHYWIYRERIGDVDGREPHWYLHGLFG